MPTLQSHTYRIRTKPPAGLKCGKRVPAPPHQKSNFHPSKKFKNTTHIRHKNSWTEAAKTYTDTDFTMTEDRRPTANNVLRQLAVIPLRRDKLWQNSY